ncbi:putative bifunctional diguanylate cyclase/phosphodiesterase [Solimicrobium silvestre]|uniref:GGDEF: diguanylate cyclase (GGDEF) domain n=1 Tax=Solimicrobium silvestre TaxID=2099400 RepID=A0A2S9GYL8_9BURK|nr:EAL domain-containing protein [Solimicrobium silvestre]PRC92803.1 GGDEF: diguanylate cyclase (GGDEF) domain [Solimicrobium silvestre]
MPKKLAMRNTTISHVYLIIAMFVAMIITLTFLMQIQMNALMAVRAYIGGAGVWAKAQKEAILSLEHYALTHDENDYQNYQRSIQIPIGDLQARIALQKPNPDLAMAREGFLIGGNHPEDIESMSDLFLRFQNFSFMTEVIKSWTTGDKLIAELNEEAEKLHQDISSHSINSDTVHTFMIRTNIINQHLTEQENLFSSTLATISRSASHASRNFSYTIALLFTLLGVGISWTIIARIRAIDTVLHNSEAYLRIAATAFESQENLIITDANEVILRVNKAFTENTGYSAEEIIGQTPRLLKSGRHPPEFYKEMWETIQLKGAWQGEIWGRRKNGQIYPKWLSISAVKGAGGHITHYIGSYIDITERKEAEEKIKYIAFHDHLTNLPNRRLLLDRLQQALTSNARSGRKGALLFIDLDNFKDLNDTLGHDTGDLLLQQVAQRLEASFRENDTVSRMGGDEFVVMLLDLSEHHMEAATQTELIGEKTLAILSQPYQLDKYELTCTASIGITLFDGNDQMKDELMKQADIAMYQAKKAGRNTLRFFDNQMQDAITIRTKLDTELHKALESQQFQLYYQIQVDNARRPIGAEALIRWQHPTRGVVFPGEFIALAEETGLILPIGKWVLDTACAQIKAWQNDASTQALVLAVNVSANQFRQADFVSQVQTCVQLHAINPMLLKLELTESLMLKDVDDTIVTMNSLKEIGVQLSLDDFGTGYSSLQYLKRLPFDQIKIDRSFVRDIATDPNDAAIVQTIIAMAKTLGLNVIAEGVETEEQREFLNLRGCYAYQGYLFGKPVPLEQFEAMLELA